MCHFYQAIEGSKALEDIENHNDAVLLLWKVQNKANLRLAGDISEDPTFPKLIFPTKEFCSGWQVNYLSFREKIIIFILDSQLME